MLKCTCLILRHIHNRNKKLKFAIVSAANLVLFYFFLLPIASFCLYEDILENVNKNVYSRRSLERVSQVTVNITQFSPN